MCLLYGANKFSGSELARATPPHLGVDPRQYRLAGILELLAAVGLVLAALGAVAAWLGAAAAFGMALMMAFAIAFHLRAGDGFMPQDTSVPGWAPAAFVGLKAQGLSFRYTDNLQGTNGSITLTGTATYQ